MTGCIVPSVARLFGVSQKMRVILIHPSAIELYGKWEDSVGVWPPLGIAYIAAFLEKYSHTVKIIDANAEHKDIPSVIKEIIEFKPDIIGITSVTVLIMPAFKLAKAIKSVMKIPVVLGGPHPTTVPLDTIQNEDVDFVVRGEGEHTMLELLRRLEKDEGFEGVGGLTFKKEGKVVENPRRELIEDLDTLPRPAFHLLPIERYKTRSYSDNGRPWVSMCGSRGCPSLCNFCAAPVIHGRRPRFRSQQNIVEEMKYLRDKYGVGNITFVDSTLNINKEKTIKLCQLIIKEKVNMEWQCEARVSSADEESLKYMYKSGCRLVAFGIESGDEKILKIIKKGITIEQAERAVKAAKKAGLMILTSFIFGHFGETRQTAGKTIDFAIKLNANISFFFILTPFPGTEVYEELTRQGKIIHDWTQYSIGYSKRTPCVETEELKRADLEEFVNIAHKRFFFRPAYIINHFKHLNNWRRVKREFNSFIQVMKLVLNRK